MKRILVVFGVIIVSGATLFLIRQFKNRHDEGVLMASGNVEVTETDIGFEFTGRITGLFAEEGQRVNMGDRLALLDSAELESQVVQNRAFLDESRARLAELKAGSRPAGT